MYLKPNLAWTLYTAGRYDEALRPSAGLIDQLQRPDPRRIEGGRRGLRC